MNDDVEPAVCQFYRLIPGAPEPRRADRSADGTLPVVAYRYCEAVAAASGFGWYLYPPLTFSLVFDGTQVAWTYEGADGWEPLRTTAQYPDFPQLFRDIAPDAMGELAPTFLAQGRLPGFVQIWSGYLARTASRWALLSRGVANLAKIQPYETFEGIVETDTWFGPLFTNIRLTQTNSPVQFHRRSPLFQVQPLRRECYGEPPFAVHEAADLNAEDWRRFAATMIPNTDHMRALGHYAADTRRRLRGAAREGEAEQEDQAPRVRR
ncbi:MAG TPA: DUF6065 family protein [Stellaceae bacterium]|nr:DUF6065 family protein [Stellaceae bacterium]